MKRILSVIIILLFSINLKSQNLDFYKEYLTFEISEGYFTVNGSYHLKNNDTSAIVTTLYYPFPMDSSLGRVDTFFIYNVNKPQEKVITKSSNQSGFFLLVNIAAKSEGVYQIYYRQKLISNKAEYILTTTQLWHKPLDYAEYELIVPKSIEIKKFSYPPDSKVEIEDKAIYQWKKYNFMPNRNMVFWF